MNDNELNAIEVFKNRVKDKEDELSRLKKAVNDMARDLGLPPVYASVASESTATLTSLRGDQFYGQGLSTAIRMYLEMRKASGLSSASVGDIYEAVKAGGYKFETKDEDNAKTGVRNTLRKNTAQFHRLPSGEYGLLSWYPNAKPAKSESDDNEPEKKPRESKAEKPDSKKEANDDQNFFSLEQIRDAINATTGNFMASDIEKVLKTNFPSKTFRTGALPNLIFTMKAKRLLKLVAERQGNRGATYCKA